MKSLYSILFALWGVAALAEPGFWKHEWPNTDFSVTSVENWVEIISGGPGRDGIPALIDPEFEPVGAKSGLGAREAVIALEIQGEARAYPLRYLMWHEIVNDEVGGVPVAVTFCPLCNSAVSFDRRVGAAPVMADDSVITSGSTANDGNTINTGGTRRSVTIGFEYAGNEGMTFSGAVEAFSSTGGVSGNPASLTANWSF